MSLKLAHKSSASRQRTVPLLVLLCSWAALTGWLPGSYSQALAAEHHLSHNLAVELHLDAAKLSARDEITVDPFVGGLLRDGTLTFALTPHAVIRSVLVNGEPVAAELESGRLKVPVPSGKPPFTIVLAYEAEFSDALPQDPVNFDNPGFGVTGTITKEGAFLLAGSGWYPDVMGTRSCFRLQVTAPRSIYAVTAGRLVGHEDRERVSVSTFEVEDALEGISLSAGPYVIRSRMAGKTPVLTYFFPETDYLSKTYLDAAAAHLQFFEELHGPYPFPKFAVVENFFPTGYGFPSYTLMGTSVLRLPFIPATSLMHEVAHCWWGNGVLMDPESGNWSEGLTTYVADYLSKERSSPEEARFYRRQILQDYAALAAGEEDFPLKDFRGRVSPATRSVGYGKAAFVFHMVRRQIGDERFWESLRQIYRERLFKETSWTHFQDIFVRVGGWAPGEATIFFNQWLNRPGAPLLRFDGVGLKESATDWVVEGRIGQRSPAYLLDLPLQLETDAETMMRTVRVSGELSGFYLESGEELKRLVGDPDHHVFRLLYQEEIPPTVNSLRGARELVPITAVGTPDELKDALRTLLAGLGMNETPVRSEADVAPDQIEGRDLLFLGMPRSDELKQLIGELPAGLEVTQKGFSSKLDGVQSPKQSVSSENDGIPPLKEGVQSQGSGGPSRKEVIPPLEGDCLFLVHRTPAGRTVGLLLPSPGWTRDSVATAARKIVHYGKYSYLVFSGGIIQDKGTWPAARSPLIIDFPAATISRYMGK